MTIYYLGGNNIRQHRRNSPLPRACVPSWVGQVWDDARGCRPLLRHLGARVRHVCVLLSQQTGQQRCCCAKCWRLFWKVSTDEIASNYLWVIKIDVLNIFEKKEVLIDLAHRKQTKYNFIELLLLKICSM